MIRSLQGHINLNLNTGQKMNVNISTGEFPNLLQNDKLLVRMPKLTAIRTELQAALRCLTEHPSHIAPSGWDSFDGNYDRRRYKGKLLNEELHPQQYRLPKIVSHEERTERARAGDCPPAGQESLRAERVQKMLAYPEGLPQPVPHQPKPHLLLLLLAVDERTHPQGRRNLRELQFLAYAEGTNKPPQHSQIHNLERQLKKLYHANSLNGLNLYLYGLVLNEQERTREARKVFIDSLNDFPYNWSAWLELCKIIESEDLNAITVELNDHWLKNFYFGHLCLQKYKNDICIDLYYGIHCFFRHSNFIMNQIAHSFYNSQQFDSSSDWYQKLLSIDPYRYENMDTYSNILYIRENQGELANLALKSFYNNKYYPETCCVVGNYYSLMGEHLKAIVYFRKALKLDRTCLAAWTLMGHEYLQMKNIPGAIEAYRSAVEIDPKDFRAWYGLGQTYELQNMNNYALYYYSRAVLSRPKDSRMWNAMGCCYQKMGKSNEAQRCYVRAENSKDREGIAIHQMGKLYHAMGPEYEQKAVNAFQLNLKRKEEENANDKELGECLLYLSRYYKKIGQVEKAIQLARRLSDLQGIEKDEANKLLQELNLLS